MIVFSRIIQQSLILTLVFWGATVSPIGNEAKAGNDINQSVECDVHAGSCRAELADQVVTMDIQPKPVRAMEDLTFRVTVSGKQPPASLFIGLGMPGMKMGPNSVKLGHKGQGVYQGTGVIVRCPSGRRTWYSRINVPNTGIVEFVFDVVY